MSSHHIIREDQEPAIFIFQVENCWESLDELLEWSPKVLVEESYQNQIESRQTKIDGLISCSQAINTVNENDFQYTHHHFCESLNQWLVDKNYTAINIFCDVNILLNIFNELEKTQLMLPLNIYTKLGRCILKPSKFFKKGYPKEAKVVCLNEYHTANLTNLDMSSIMESYQFDGMREFRSKSDFIIIIEEISSTP